MLKMKTVIVTIGYVIMSTNSVDINWTNNSIKFYEGPFPIYDDVNCPFEGNNLA